MKGLSYDLTGAEFWVNGSSIPLVDFDVGDSWAGLLPISNATDETRQVCVFKLVVIFVGAYAQRWTYFV